VSFLSNGFWRGVIAGSIIGGIVGVLMSPKVPDETRERWVDRGRQLRNRAERLIRRARNDIDEALEER